MRKKITRSILLLFLAGSLLYASLVFYVHSHAFIDSAAPADAIIVLGTRPNTYGANPCLVARVRQAASLYRKGLAPKIVFSGGKLGGDTFSEAEVMERIAPDFGIAQEDIFVESRSTSTHENLLFSSEILSREGLSSVIIVSDAYHLPRAALIAKKLGMHYTLSPAQDSPCTTQRHNIVLFSINEPLKMVLYAITGKL